MGAFEDLNERKTPGSRSPMVSECINSEEVKTKLCRKEERREEKKKNSWAKVQAEEELSLS